MVHDESDDTLPQTPDDRPDETRDLARESAAHVAREGTTIGRYTVGGVLGEGGFGIVYRAEQTEPVRRTVALKVIKPGMDSRAVVSRFEAERQALALMSHPCVASVYDGGLSDEGRPYFAMEFVEGMPIDEFCDRERLSVAARVRLLIEVCGAVQHAHAKGVIHRDLKPGNILVSLVDGKPSPKVIDFGIAKAIDQRLASETIFTQQGQMIGTPAYMSPEQAGGDGRDVDTRADVYALGAVLYELVAGARPFEPETLRRASLAEMQRIIREVEPARPSTRLREASDAGDTSAIAERRDTEMRSLGTLLRRDLDWVVMKCLEKDRERRYETPDALASDLRRFLENEPVQAGPPTASYRVGKFVRRHRAGVVTAGVVALTLAVATGVSVYFGITASRASADRERQRLVAVSAQIAEAEERERAEGEAAKANAVLGFFTRRFEETNPLLGTQAGARGVDGAWSSSRLTEFLKGCARAIDDELGEQPEVRARVRAIVGASLTALGEVPEGREQMRLALDELPVDSLEAAETRLALGQSHVISQFSTPDEYRDAAELLRVASDALEAQLGPEHERTMLARILRMYAQSYLASDVMDLELIIATQRESEALGAACLRLFGEDHPLTLLCSLRGISGRGGAAFLPPPMEEIEELIDRSRAALGSNNLIELFAQDQKLNAASARGNREMEIEVGRDLTDVAIALLGPTHDEAVWFLHGYLAMLVHHGEFARIEAFLDEEPECEQALREGSEELHGYTLYARGRARLLEDDREAGADYFERAAEVWRTTPEAGRTRQHMATMLRDLARLRDDPELMEEARRWRDATR